MKYLLMLCAVLMACSTSEAAHSNPARPWRQPGDVVDSILPMAEYERRFRIGTEPVTTLGGGAADREQLARAFLAAVADHDSLALQELVVTRDEFAWLLFPQHRYREEPYALDPGVLWMQVTTASRKGRSRVLDRHGGQRLAFRALACTADTLQLRPGPARAWTDCRLEFQAGDTLLTRRMFGSIIERDGRAKFLGYANDF